PQSEPTYESTISYSSFGAGEAVAEPAKKSGSLWLFLILGVVVVGLLAAALFLFMGGGGSGYERAERRALSSLDDIFAAFQVVETDKMEMTVSVSDGVMALIGDTGIPGLDDLSFKFNYQSIVEGSDAYASFGVDALGMSLSALLWVLDEQVIMQIPELSDYFLLLSDVDASFDTADYEAAIKDLEKVGNKVLDRYFELTKDVKSTDSQLVTHGALSRECDVYEISIDGALMLELAKTAFEEIQKSNAVMKVGEEILGMLADADPYFFYGADFNDFKGLVSFAIDSINELIDSGYFNDEVFAVMKVYISKNDVIRRDIVIEDVLIAITTIKDGSDYANVFEVWHVGTVFSCTDTGSEARDGALTGTMKISFSDGWSDFTVDIKYADLKTHKNGLFSGSFDVSVPLPAEMVRDILGDMGALFAGTTVEVSFKSAVTGDTQDTSGYITILGLRIADIEVAYSVNTGGRISPPALSGSNTIDMNDLYDMDRYGESLLEGLYAMLGDNALGEMLFGVMMNPGFGGGWDDTWESWDDWDDYDWTPWPTPSPWVWEHDPDDPYCICDDCWEARDWNVHDPDNEWCICDDCWEARDWNVHDPDDEWCICDDCWEAYDWNVHDPDDEWCICDDCWDARDWD
ncbi:MAG: hypothetical protein FWE60_02580, partial [Oscillospiraceae bacterium]|nr:hypothetical protein [Oscillospiraceae bacterium]